MADETDKTATGGGEPEPRAKAGSRQTRLEQALRANLLKRKEKIREGQSSSGKSEKEDRAEKDGLD